MTHADNSPLYLWLTKEAKQPADSFLEAAIAKFAAKWWNKDNLPPNILAANPNTLTDELKTQAAKYGIQILEIPSLPLGIHAFTKSDPPKILAEQATP